MKSRHVLFLLIFLLLPAIYAQTSSSGDGGKVDAPLGLIISPTNGTIFISSNVDILVSASSNTGLNCKFTGRVYNELNEYKEIRYKDCPFCDLKDSFFTLANAYYDAVPGWSYKVDIRCNDKSGNTETKTVYFTVQGNRNEDKTAPELNIKSPINNIKNLPNTKLDFEVNELSHCGYTLASLDSSSGGAGHVSIDGYINNHKSDLALTEVENYILTLGCKDLNDNSVSKEIKFSVSSGITSTSGSGGGGSRESCQKYYTCPDGTKIEYCKTVTKEIPSKCVPSDIPGAGPVCSPGSVSVKCECIEDPRYSCPEIITTSTTIQITTITTLEYSDAEPEEQDALLYNKNKTTCDNGCLLDNKCFQIGFRKDNAYCSINHKFIDQKNEDLTCENNFECDSNLCIDNKCLSSSLWQKILIFFRKFF